MTKPVVIIMIFIEIKENANEKLGVVVGDVAGHGISSALHMAAVRSALRL